MDLHPLDARCGQRRSGTARALAPVAGQTEDRVPDPEEAGVPGAARSVLELLQGMEAVDVEQDAVVGRLEAELDPDVGALPQALELAQGLVRETVRTGRDRQRHDRRTVAVQFPLQHVEDLAEAAALHVSVRVALEVRDRAGLGVGGAAPAARDPREALAELLREAVAVLQGSRPGSLHVAVGAAPEALRPVAVRAGGARVERDAVDGASEAGA